MLIARTVLRASTGLLKDKPLRHRARPAVRASTRWKQEDLLRHPASPVLRTRPRLLRAVLEPPALATQATVATLAQEHVQRVLQASTNLQEGMVLARTALRASTGLLQDKLLRHPARPVLRTRPRLLIAVLEPHALVMQATVATPAQGIAQRA